MGEQVNNSRSTRVPVQANVSIWCGADKASDIQAVLRKEDSSDISVILVKNGLASFLIPTLLLVALTECNIRCCASYSPTSTISILPKKASAPFKGSFSSATSTVSLMHYHRCYQMQFADDVWPFGGVHLGQAVWKGLEGALKEWEKVDPQGDEKAGCDEDCGLIPQAVSYIGHELLYIRGHIILLGYHRSIFMECPAFKILITAAVLPTATACIIEFNAHGTTKSQRATQMH
ncbi:hypothetical protein BDR04DRAFT_1117890 [Suillus decipiens]|nr:hypothetical protein BDR04DRAFT_1117890 [Suillus decipiens]